MQKRKKAYSLSLLARELELLRRFTHWNIVTGYGGCVDETAPDDDIALVTEYVDAYTLAELHKQALPWCVRAKLAIDLAVLVKYLDEAGPVVHCDWKADQFVVRRKDYRVVLVDVDSLVEYERGGAYLADHECTGADEAECAQFGAECFQEEARRWTVPDARCDTARGRCIGFNTGSIVWSLARGILIDFLGAPLHMMANRRGPSPDAVRGTKMYRETLINIIRNGTLENRDERWDIHRILAELRSMYSQGNGKECLTRWNWHKRLV